MEAEDVLMPELLDPVEPPEGGGGMRAADLINRVCVFRPQSIGEWPAKPPEWDENGNMIKKEQKASTYVECSVWVLDRAGIVEEGTGVRVSWWKAVEQLKAAELGSFIGGKPQQEEGGKAIFLAMLTGEAREVAAKAIAVLGDDGSDWDGNTPI